MPKKSNQNHDKKDSNKVDEPITEYNLEKETTHEEELHPVLVKLLEKSIKNHEEGKVFSHEEVMKKVKERYPFLK